MINWFAARMPRSLNGEGIIYWQIMLGNWISTCIRMKLESYCSPYTKVNSKCSKHLNVRAKNIKFFKENIVVNFHNLGYDKEFLFYSVNWYCKWDCFLYFLSRWLVPLIFVMLVLYSATLLNYSWCVCRVGLSSSLINH